MLGPLLPSSVAETEGRIISLRSISRGEPVFSGSLDVGGSTVSVPELRQAVGSTVEVPDLRQASKWALKADSSRTLTSVKHTGQTKVWTFVLPENQKRNPSLFVKGRSNIAM